MNFSEYQIEAQKTAIYPEEANLIYPAMGLGGEAGEILNKVKKVLRDDGWKVTKERKEDLKCELGDVLWYISALASDLDINLDDIAKDNLRKVQSRKDRGKLGGSGDNR